MPPGRLMFAKIILQMQEEPDSLAPRVRYPTSASPLPQVRRDILEFVVEVPVTGRFLAIGDTLSLTLNLIAQSGGFTEQDRALLQAPSDRPVAPPPLPTRASTRRRIRLEP